MGNKRPFADDPPAGKRFSRSSVAGAPLALSEANGDRWAGRSDTASCVTGMASRPLAILGTDELLPVRRGLFTGVVVFGCKNAGATE